MTEQTAQEFQFHKGTIKTKKLSNMQTLKNYFNSIKVRLKQSADGFAIHPSEFQFHKGTIKT